MTDMPKTINVTISIPDTLAMYLEAQRDFLRAEMLEVDASYTAEQDPDRFRFYSCVCTIMQDLRDAISGDRDFDQMLDYYNVPMDERGPIRSSMRSSL